MPGLLVTTLATDLPTEPQKSSDLAATKLRRLIEHAAHFLPSQGPIEVFVHHNTLHAFEDHSFHEALRLGLDRYQAEPYLSLTEYRRLYHSGRITDQELEAVVMEDLGESCNNEINGLGTRSEIRYAMLRHAVRIGPDAELRWIVAETDALDRFREEATEVNRSRILSAAKRWLHNAEERTHSVHDVDGLLEKFGRDSSRWKIPQWEAFALHLIWRTCLAGVASYSTTPQAKSFVRPRDWLLHTTGHDIDQEVHEVLIRFCGAYVDQGYSDWILPNRDDGFFSAFLSLYSIPVAGSDRWLNRLPGELKGMKAAGITAEESIRTSLDEFGIAEEDREEFITQSLLSLAGWAGMIWQLESGVDWAVHAIPKGSLVGMLAVQLILEKHAIRNLGREVFDASSIPEILKTARSRMMQPEAMTNERRAFLLFQVAQMLGWTPLELQQLTPPQWRQLSNEVEGFSPLERRRIFHEAYERHYRDAALNAFATHSARRRNETPPWRRSPSKRPSFQIVTCIDDREESFRRHMEEVQPMCETFGAAGFFAVAMYYRGAADGFYKPLCPGVITPDHYVCEDVGYSFEGVHRERAELRRRLGLAGRIFHTRSRTFLGGAVAGIVGSLAAVPLIARVLFPRLTSQIRERFGTLVQPPPVTQLHLERYEDEPGPIGGHIGYAIDEMASVVTTLLRDIGLTRPKDFSRLFVVCGHGSSSLNNPHESAYCCGACAGKRGGPNARAFAQMANDWRVRAKVSELGIQIPDDTTFVGAYHNTCDDSVVFFDLDRLPSSHRDDFESARDAIDEARCRNAQERCRRFESARLNLTPKEALRHVEGRAQDISQARPEYNHATNALCLVGRRHWSRGLFLDRRAFLTSYDPSQDDEDHNILLRILSAVIPVCAGINLEYYFSCVDYSRYGSGSKLPHNLVSLLGVMEGTSSDLRTGLYQQMVEIHEPMRILFVIESTAEAMLSILRRNAGIERLVRNCWVHLAVIDPATSEIQIFHGGRFEPFKAGTSKMREVDSSLSCYLGSRDHLPFASIRETETAS